MNRLHKATPWHLWLVGILALAWNGFGAADYTMTQLENRDWFGFMGFDAAQTDAVLAYMDASPMWTHAAWAIGVWGGVVGAILLLLRKRTAVAAFAVSFLGAALGLVNHLTADIPAELQEMADSPVMFGVVAIAAALLWYAWAMRKRGILA